MDYYMYRYCLSSYSFSIALSLSFKTIKDTLVYIGAPSSGALTKQSLNILQRDRTMVLFDFYFFKKNVSPVDCLFFLLDSVMQSFHILL